MVQMTCCGSIGAPARHGAQELLKTVNQTGFNSPIYLGKLDSDHISKALARGDVRCARTGEAFGIGVCEGCVYIAGFDDTGLMYGCFALAEMLESGQPARSIQEEPYLKTRGIYELPHNRDLESERFYSKAYWTEYFNMLARNRINSFNYVYSHQTGYMAPVFAYFTRDEKYPDARPIDIPGEMIDRNREMMAFITELAHDRGITFILGIWEVYPWRGGQGDWRPPQANAVPGVTEDILEDYVYRGAKAMLTEFPCIDGIQVRVNEESSITSERQTEFFKNTIFKAVAETGKLMDYRGWLALPETTETVKSMCPNLRTSMKYWAEFLGAPYQPCKIEPGYSYGNLLEKPMPYRFMWQVWSLGSPRLLLWGDPEYVQRFAQSCKLGGAEGFEINPPLAQKGYGNEPGYWRIFKNPADEYYTHEYERYWMFYMLFGRMAYNPGLPKDVWMRELQKRVGDHAKNVMEAYKLSSRVITFLVQYSLSDPNMYIWPEIDLGGLLEFYIETPTSDKCTLSTVPEYIDNLIKNIPCGKFTPHQSAELFKAFSDGILAALEQPGIAEAGESNRELAASLVDFHVMAHLSRYHSLKIEAALRVQAYFRTGDGSGLREAEHLLRDATMQWEAIISLTEDRYYDRMVTGPSDAGCWKAKRRLAYEDELRLKEIIALHERFGLFEKGFDFGRHITMQGFENRPFDLFKTFSVEKRFTGVTPDTRFTAISGFGIMTGEWGGIAMARPRLTDRTADWKYRRDALYNVHMENMRGYRSPLTEDYLSGEGEAEFACSLENGRYSVTLLFADESVKAKAHGPFSACVNGVCAVQSEAVLPLEKIERTVVANVTDGKLTLALSGRWFISAMFIRRMTPAIAHMPPRALAAGEWLYATATVPQGEISEVSVLLQGASIPMTPLGNSHYRADVSHFLNGTTPIEYRIRACQGGLCGETDAFTLVAKQTNVFKACHDAPGRIKAGQELALSLTVSPEPAAVLLHYSRANQYDGLETVDMGRQGDSFAASVPGEYILPTRDLLYYFEILNNDGFGVIYPDFRVETPYYVAEVEA